MSSHASPRIADSAVSICRTCRARLTRQHQQPRRSFALSSLRPEKTPISRGPLNEDLAEAPPRWQRAPDRMKAPFKVRPANKNDDYTVNEDPDKLDRALESVLGVSVRGSAVLEDDVKWLVVTHKSFDHGRRGMNDRLAFLGRRICELQTSLALLDAPAAPAAARAADQWQRTPPADPALSGLENVSATSKADVLSPERMASLAQRYGLQKVIRWKPRRIENLKASGLDSVLAQTMYAVVGAVALQSGGEAAVQTTKERILRPLGVL